MKKTAALLLVILVGTLPIGPASAQTPAEGSLEEAVSLLYASRSILLDEVDLTDVSRAPGAVMAAPMPETGDAGEALGHLIHATKQQRNNLQDSCRQLRAAYQSEGKTCEVQILNDYCQAEEAKLNQRIGLLHKLRGDRRKFFTRAWHSLKRTGTRVWTAVGPVGRRILRNVGSEAAEVVLSGGSLSGGVIRKLLIKEARGVGEAELNRLLERGVGTFLQSQAALAQAAGISDCTADKLEEARQQVAEDAGLSPETENNENDPEPENPKPSITFTGQSSFVCKMFVGDGGDDGMMGNIPLDVNFDGGDFQGEASFSYVKDDGFLATSTWVYEGSVSSDGLLIGTSKVSVTVNNVDVGSISLSSTALGIVADDGKGIYLSTFPNPDPEMLQAFDEGREAVQSHLFWDLSNSTPTCR